MLTSFGYLQNDIVDNVLFEDAKVRSPHLSHCAKNINKVSTSPKNKMIRLDPQVQPNMQSGVSATHGNEKPCMHVHEGSSKAG